MGASIACVGCVNDRKCGGEEFEGGLPTFDREWWSGVLQGRGVVAECRFRDPERLSGGRSERTGVGRLPTLLTRSTDDLHQRTAACKDCSDEIAELRGFERRDSLDETRAKTVADKVKGMHGTQEQGQAHSHHSCPMDALCDAEHDQTECGRRETQGVPVETYGDRATVEAAVESGQANMPCGLVAGPVRDAQCEEAAHTRISKRALTTAQMEPIKGCGVADAILMAARKPEWDSVRGKSKAEIEKVLGLGVVAERLRAAANAEKDQAALRRKPRALLHKSCTARPAVFADIVA